MYTLFRTWGLKIDPTDLQGRDHPPTLLRYEMVMANAHLDVSDVCPELDNQFVEIVRSGQEEAEKGIVYSGGDPLPSDDVVGSNDPKVTSHLNALVNHLDNVLSPQLQEYAFIQIGKRESTNREDFSSE
jgi:hypothetical protein